MEVEQVLHMKGGEGYTSYANNSLHPRTIIAMVKPTLEETIEEVYLSTLSPKCLKMADLGCAAGPNTLLVVSQVMDSVRKTCQKLDRYSQPPSLQVFLNDLPGNDFNALFRSFSGFGGNMMEELLGEGSNNFGPCFFAGVPGSFYGRLFPNDSLHFFYSSYALMWISKVPKGLVSEAGEALNKGNLCIAKTSPPEVHKAYFEQFQRDFTLFLKSRAEELVPGGGMVLTILGSMKSNDPLNIWEFIGLKLNDMVLEGLIEMEKLDTFNLPFYAATSDEFKGLIEAEGSFALRKIEIFKNDWDTYIKKANSGLDKQARAAIIANGMRAVGEPILVSQFGEAVMDNLFCRVKEEVLDHMVMHKCENINIVISLIKKLC